MFRRKNESIYLSIRTYSSLKMPKYTVKISKGQDGYYVAQCVELPAAITQGRTREEALTNIREAITLVLEDTEIEAEEKGITLVEVEV